MSDWPLFEVFIRSRAGLEHKHVGSVHAADVRMAIEHAREGFAVSHHYRHFATEVRQYLAADARSATYGVGSLATPGAAFDSASIRLAATNATSSSSAAP